MVKILSFQEGRILLRVRAVKGGAQGQSHSLPQLPAEGEHSGHPASGPGLHRVLPEWWGPSSRDRGWAGGWVTPQLG